MDRTARAMRAERCSAISPHQTPIPDCVGIQLSAWPDSEVGFGTRLKFAAATRIFAIPTPKPSAPAGWPVLPVPDPCMRNQHLSHADLSWLLQNRLNAGPVGVNCLRSISQALQEQALGTARALWAPLNAGDRGYPLMSPQGISIGVTVFALMSPQGISIGVIVFVIVFDSFRLPLGANRRAGDPFSSHNALQSSDRAEGQSWGSHRPRLCGAAPRFPTARWRISRRCRGTVSKHTSRGGPSGRGLRSVGATGRWGPRAWPVPSR